jgi:hypothetical protein
MAESLGGFGKAEPGLTQVWNLGLARTLWLP